MLNAVLAHQGQLVGPHDLWGAWHLDPLVVGSLALAAWAYRRGARWAPPGAGWRAASFAAALAVLVSALVSPLDALSAQLASAHMVQHVLLALVAPPLLVLSDAGRRLPWGVPAPWRRAATRWQRQVGLDAATPGWARAPSVAWLATAGVLWFWHGSVPYQAALRSDAVHAVEHALFLATGVMFWSAIARLATRRAGAEGYGVLLLFAMATQSALLAALLTFARSPWYPDYADTTARWGWDPLVDQQVAGVVMWVPAGAIYPLAALVLIVRLLRRLDGSASSLEPLPASARTWTGP